MREKGSQWAEHRPQRAIWVLGAGLSGHQDEGGRKWSNRDPRMERACADSKGTGNNSNIQKVCSPGVIPSDSSRALFTYTFSHRTVSLRASSLPFLISVASTRKKGISVPGPVG